ncbi:hypothetical protein JIQ42_08075 [Leishmania sp. Namibia]|uniref:hypothetical protein n=1 Tax=Leishmania sp. Namibia TaxID=2802991 RepID=UPI001B4C01AB|nr:hypothetical protein JIQ42_08075 [Leishmania sp. Namibia]
MLSFRDVAATPDDADVLRTSLEELYRRRHAKQEAERERKRREQNRVLDDDADGWSTAQELAYRRDVLNTWARQYPKLREAVVSLTTASSNAAAVISPSLTAATAFSVAETIRPSYPSLWRIPAGTIPADFYEHTVTMDASQLLSTPQRQRATTVAMKDRSAHSCLVRVQWEALRLTDASLAAFSSVSALCLPPSLHLSGSIGYAPPQPQRVLARWPKGRPASAKMAAVLRSIDIEERKREQWNEHLRRQQQQLRDDEGAPHQRPRDEAHYRPSAVSVTPSGYRARSTDSDRSSTEVVAADEPYSACTAVNAKVVDNGASESGGAADTLERALGHELYWPARITRTRALFTGATCLQDTFHGLGQLQRHDRFEPVLALALASPLRIVVDVVYTIDETSEALGLPIDPVVHVPAMTSLDARKNAPARRDCDRLRSASPGSRGGSSAGKCGSAAARHGTPPSFEMPSSVAEDECPVLLPSSLPPVLSDLNYAFAAAPTAAGAASGGGSTVDNSHSASQWTSLTDDLTTASAAELRRSSLSTSPLSLYTILAGPVSQTHLMVLLRPTPDVVCAARARALQELEQRWQRLRQALADRLVAYEEEAPTTAAAQPPSDVLAVQLPDADTYVSPFIDRTVRQDEGLPAKPPGAVSLTEEEMQRQTRLPQLQGGRLPRRPPTHQVVSSNSVNGGQLRQRLSATSLGSPPMGPGLRGVHGSASPARSPPNTMRRSLHSNSAQGDGVWAPAALPWSALTPPTSPRTPRADQRASVADGAVTISAVVHHRDTAAVRTPPSVRLLANPISLCSPAPSDGVEAAHTGMSSSHLDGLRTSSLSESRSTAIEESHAISAAVRDAGERLRAMEAAARTQQRPVAGPRALLPTLTVEAPSPVSAGIPRLANDTGRVDSSAATGSAGKASPSSNLSLPPRRRHSNCSPMNAETATQSSRAGDSPRHRTWRGMESCSVILSGSTRSVPDSTPMSALQEPMGTAHLSRDMHNGISSTLNQQSSTGGDGGLVAPLSDQSGTTPLAPLPLSSRLTEVEALQMPNLSTPTTACIPLSIGGDSAMSSIVSSPSHAENDSQSPSSVPYPALRQSQTALCLADAPSSRGNITDTTTQRSATQPLAPPLKPPLQLSTTARSTRSAISGGDEAHSTLARTSRPADEVFVDKRGDRTRSALPARDDTGTEDPLSPQSTCATASAPSSPSDDVLMLSGTAKYLPHTQADLLSAVVQEKSASERSGATACDGRGDGDAAARESQGIFASSLRTSSPAPSALHNQRRRQLCDPELVQPGGMLRASPQLLTAVARAPTQPVSSLGSALMTVEVNPQQRSGSRGRNSPGTARHGSSHTSDREERGGSPLPCRPPSLAPSLTIGANRDALKAVSHPSSSTSEASKAVSPSQVRPWPSLKHASGAGARDLARGNPRPPALAQEGPSGGMHARDASPEAPEPGSHSVLSASVNRKVGLPEQHVRFSGALTPRSPPPSQQQQAHLATVNALVSTFVSAGESATDLHNLHECMHSIREDMLEAALGDTCMTLSRSDHTDVRSSHRPAHPHHLPGYIEKETTFPSPCSTLSVSAAPLTKSQYAAQRRSPRRRSRRHRNTDIEELGAVAPTAQLAPRMRQATPSAKSVSSADIFTSPMSSWATSSRGASPVFQPNSRSLRHVLGGDRGPLVAPSHRRSGSSQHNSQQHLVASRSLSPVSSARRHVVVVRRVVRRRRSEVFVKEGGALVSRAPMPLSRLQRSSGE